MVLLPDVGDFVGSFALEQGELDDLAELAGAGVGEGEGSAEFDFGEVG